jgi:hypothetical protein
MVDTSVKPTTKAITVGEEGDSSRIIVVDIGKKQKKKAIKRLRQGRGRLVAKVEDAISEIREEGGITGSSPVVVVVVRRKNKCRRWLL